MTTNKQDSPFKFLDAYQKEEKDMFFGRDRETETLYQMTFDTRLLLTYGASGTGKTSLIQAGLANKFSPTRWKDIFVRRNDNINHSLKETLNEELDKVKGKKPEEEFPPMEALEKLHRRTLKPLYLIFDQFEELFVLSQEKEEEEEFFLFIEEVLDSNLPCKIILIMREEFLANLWPFEQRLPSLFNYRFRVERMRESQIKEVIQKTLQHYEEKGDIKVEKGQLESIAHSIYTKLAGGNDKAEIELTYLQVYLDSLYKKAREETQTGPPLFTLDLANSMGDIEDVIGDFLDGQLVQLEQPQGTIRPGIPIRILGGLVSEEQTKKVLPLGQLREDLQQYNVSEEELQTCLQAFVNMRILKPYQE